MPYQIIVMGGEMDNLKKLNELYVDQYVQFWIYMYICVAKRSW